ncbi:hypothetical protein DL767_006169 [Monosporascus sp. MG133]|nr:hypothetical protein DL767_006169 [Monosporascus sp. MG133]
MLKGLSRSSHIYGVWQEALQTNKPLFLKDRHATLEPPILGKVDRLYVRLEEESDVITLTHAFIALTVDIISRVCFDASYGSLENNDFAREWYAGMVSGSSTGHMVRQGASADKGRQMELKQNIADVVDRHRLRREAVGRCFTIFDSMLDADVPASEKSFLRLISEAQALTGAGAMTTANALDTTLYDVLANPNRLNHLREELASAIRDSLAIPSVAQLETFLYLIAVVQEGLRLGKACLSECHSFPSKYVRECEKEDEVAEDLAQGIANKEDGVDGKLLDGSVKDGTKKPTAIQRLEFY